MGRWSLVSYHDETTMPDRYARWVVRDGWGRRRALPRRRRRWRCCDDADSFSYIRLGPSLSAKNSKRTQATASRFRNRSSLHLWSAERGSRNRNQSARHSAAQRNTTASGTGPSRSKFQAVFRFIFRNSKNFVNYLYGVLNVIKTIALQNRL